MAQYLGDNRWLFHRVLQLNINTLQQLHIFFAQADEILPKISALKKYYVRKHELVYFRT